MSRATVLGVLTVAMLAVGASSAAAQVARNPQPPRAARAGGQLTPAEVIGMLDAWALVQAQDALQLTDAQYGQFVIRLKRLQETRRRSQRARNQILQELRKLAGAPIAPPYDEAAIRGQLKALGEHDGRAAAEIDRAYAALDDALDLPQQARFRVFEETIERRKLDILMRARQAARRGGS
jgi:hypothetical protein